MIKTSPIKLAAGAPRMIITIDTEEQFDWSQMIGAGDHQVNDPADIDRFQQLCTAFGAAPLYFLTFPMMTDDNARSYFRSLVEAGAAETGLHLHQWNTPPDSGHHGEFYSYQTNLPVETYRAKMAELARIHETSIGRRARAHRAGRYGIGAGDYEILAGAGVEFDFSPSAAFNFAGARGPDFSTCSNHPFAIEPRRGPMVYVTPVCGARAIPFTSHFLSQNKSAPGLSPHKLNMFKRLTAPMRLSPEGATLHDIKALTERLLKDETPVLTFTLHSTTLTPGATHYARTRQDVDAILETTKAYLEYFTAELGGELLSFAALERLYKNATASA